MCDCGWKTLLQSIAHCDVCACLGFVVRAVKFAEGGEGRREDREIAGGADEVPGAFEDKGLGTG